VHHLCDLCYRPVCDPNLRERRLRHRRCARLPLSAESLLVLLELLDRLQLHRRLRERQPRPRPLPDLRDVPLHARPVLRSEAAALLRATTVHLPERLLQREVQHLQRVRSAVRKLHRLDAVCRRLLVGSLLVCRDLSSDVPGHRSHRPGAAWGLPIDDALQRLLHVQLVRDRFVRNELRVRRLCGRRCPDCLAACRSDRRPAAGFDRGSAGKCD
jgi:hypothetical protein